MELQVIQTKIHKIRGQMVMLDFDLAELYGVETRTLKQAVRRNIRRFPEDFMFELLENEVEQVVSQNVIPSKSYFGGAAPFAFTEQGVAMLSTVLRSQRAIDTNIAIMRAFVALRRYAMTFDELAAKIISHDKELADINEVLRWLGEENQARSNEIAALQMDDKQPDDWENRPRIGFKK
jgi:hypothetical protein